VPGRAAISRNHRHFGGKPLHRAASAPQGTTQMLRAYMLTNVALNNDCVNNRE
jgi:hypothetical protein